MFGLGVLGERERERDRQTETEREWLILDFSKALTVRFFQQVRIPLLKGLVPTSECVSKIASL